MLTVSKIYEESLVRPDIKHFLSCQRKSTNKTKLVREKNVGWLVGFYVPSTARSFRDGAPIYCPL